LSRRELLAVVTALAADLKDQPHRTIGISAPNGIGWLLAQLACALAGKIVVPLPTFFSPAQLGHVARDASVELILASKDTTALAVQSGVPTHVIDIHRVRAGLPDVIDGFGQIIYTSGSTGQPKGVRHQSGQNRTVGRRDRARVIGETPLSPTIEGCAANGEVNV